MIESYKDLVIWQKSMDLVVAIYKLTGEFPRSEMYCLTSQMRCCAVSIPSNIAEGRERSTTKDYHKFLIIAYGSGAGLETQIEIVKRLPFGTNLNYIKEIATLLNEVMKMLNKTTHSLENQFLHSISLIPTL